MASWKNSFQSTKIIFFRVLKLFFSIMQSVGLKIYLLFGIIQFLSYSYSLKYFIWDLKCQKLLTGWSLDYSCCLLLLLPVAIKKVRIKIQKEIRPRWSLLTEVRKNFSEVISRIHLPGKKLGRWFFFVGTRCYFFSDLFSMLDPVMNKFMDQPMFQPVMCRN